MPLLGFDRVHFKCTLKHNWSVSILLYYEIHTIAKQIKKTIFKYNNFYSVACFVFNFCQNKSSE